MASVAHRAHQLMLSPCNADPTVGNRTPEYWALGMAGNAQMAQLANYARLRKLKRVYVLDSNFLYLHLMAKYFKKAAPSRGFDHRDATTSRSARPASRATSRRRCRRSRTCTRRRRRS